ncbi:hypothetical protein OG21DRAFT_832257 [Imleria badia]|nr:hypothetical protein OG21DRAFT_832257 [Imleria badia]
MPSPTRFLAHDSAPQFSSRVQIPHPTREHDASDGLHLGETVGNKIERVSITRVRATDVAIRLRRIPVGFYVAVTTERGTRRTLNKPASVCKDVMEWDDEVVSPSDRSSRISLAVFASFELEPTLQVRNNCWRVA